MKSGRRIIAVLAVVSVLVAGAFTVLLRPGHRLYVVTVLPSLRGLNMVPRSINDRGQVVGGAGPDSGVYHLFCWETARAGDSWTWPPGPLFFLMSSRGCFVGRDNSGQGGSHIVLWGTDTPLRRLFPCKPDSKDVQMTALAVNGMDQVAYTYSEAYRQNRRSRLPRFIERLFEPSVKSYVWDPKRGNIPLDRYVPPGMRSLAVRDINNRGDIVAEAHQKNGDARAVLLEPIPSRWDR